MTDTQERHVTVEKVLDTNAIVADVQTMMQAEVELALDKLAAKLADPDTTEFDVELNFHLSGQLVND